MGISQQAQRCLHFFFYLSERLVDVLQHQKILVCFNTMTKLTKAEYTMSVNECKADLFASRGLCC